MTTVSTERARIMSFEGGGDDMDEPIKKMGSDQAFAARHGLTGVNSYNIGRPLAQIVQYFWGYFRALDQSGLDTGALVDFALPAGALGNLAAGYMAKRMGLPARRFVAGVNTNDITHRTVSRGEFHRSDHMDKTLSDAINIQQPYNMERIFYYLTEEDTTRVAAWYAELAPEGRLTLPPAWLHKMQETFGSARVPDGAMCAAIRRGLDKYNYLADPHTAVALAAAWAVYGDTPAGPAEPFAPPVVVLATASPCKFEASITEAIGATRWSAYINGPDFPREARAVLEAAEVPPTRLQAKGSLQETQAAWEAFVRQTLDARASSGDCGSGGAPRSRL